jgi:hypothetical protein
MILYTCKSIPNNFHVIHCCSASKRLIKTTLDELRYYIKENKRCVFCKTINKEIQKLFNYQLLNIKHRGK